MTNKNTQLPAYNSTAWNVPLNANFQNFDDGLGTTQSMALGSASGTVAITGTVYVGAYPANTASYIPMVFVLTGTLTANVNLQIPSGVGGRWLINNQTTPSTYTITFSSAGGGSSVLCNPYSIFEVYSDGTNIFLTSSAWMAGDLKPTASAVAQNGWLLCYGQGVSTSTYAFLFGSIGYSYGGSGGTFLVPDLRGRTVAGVDAMGGTAALRLTGYTLGFTGGEQTHTLITSEMPTHTHTDSGHTHSDAGHTHPYDRAVEVGSGGIGSGVPFNLFTANTLTGHANIQSGTANIQNTGGSGAHNNIQPTMAANWLVKY